MKSIASRIGAKLNIRVQNGIQAEVFRRILATDWQSLEQFRSGDLLSRLNSDASAVSGCVTGFIPSLISSAVQFVGAFAIILCFDPVMAMIALVGVPLTALASRFLVRKMRGFNREMKQMHSEVMSFQEESLHNITTIKAFGITDFFGNRMDAVHGRYREKYLDYSRFSAWTSALMSLLSLLAYISCFGWGVYRLWNGAISYGVMTMFLQLSSSLGTAFSSLIGLVPNAISVSTSAGRIMAVAELPAENTAALEGFREEEAFTLKLSQVDFGYTGGAPVLHNTDFIARPGELVSITGPSGEGKTTLLRILLGLVLPTGGSACLAGESGREYPLCAATRQVFGYVPQGNQVFTGTVAENLRLTRPDATDEELCQALKVACAYDFVMALPGGLNHVIGGRDKRLSEGQSQRLAVARALLRRAPILLLDEATSALDPQTEQQMMKNLMESGMVRTCILVTHRPGTQKYCSRSYFIRDGIVREEA
jgi:ABC-type multidrug transport system fused ATPase/permease subunit